MRAATIVTSNVDTSDDCEEHGIVTCSTVECKRESFAINQCFANMIKLGTDLSIKSLRKGKIVDKVKVFGVAVSYIDTEAKILRLDLDFTSNRSFFTEYTNHMNLVTTINCVRSELLDM